MLLQAISKYWWLILLRGLLAIGFGVAAFTMPGMTLNVLVLIFAIFAFVDGVFDVFHAFGGRQGNPDWWVLLLEGLLGIALGIVTFQAPGISALVLLLYIAFWALATGLLRILLAVRLRKEIEGEFWLILSGLASALFGLWLIARPGEGALALLWLVAIWSIVSGLLLSLLAFRVKGLGDRPLLR
jgi:uncharacterized membrane protein HdeD (DUF308 family)